MKPDPRAPAVVNVAQFFQPALRNAAGEPLAVKLAVAGNLDFEQIGECVDDGHADAVQAAGSFVGLAVELAAGMKLGHDDFERRLARHLRMVFHGNAAAVVGDGQEAFGVEMNLDEVGVAGNRFVHRVVDDFRKQVVKGFFIGAADIHAWAHAHRFEPFEHADR